MSNSPGKKFSDYILILPEQDVIVSFTSMQDEADKRIVWGCWIREEAESVVYTALKNAKAWRRESYEIQGDQLTWSNGAGISNWNRITEADIPEILRTRGMRFLENFRSLAPPEYTTAEQDAPSNGG